jgi:hypothetical protein
MKTFGIEPAPPPPAPVTAKAFKSSEISGLSVPV